MPKKNKTPKRSHSVEFSLLDAPMSWRTIFDLANVIMVFTNDKQKITLINQKGCEVFGYSEEEIVGKNWFDSFLPKKGLNKLKDVFNKVIKGSIEPFVHFENVILTKSGDEKMIRWHNTYLKDAKGRVKFILSSGVDITEYQEAKLAMERSEAKYRTLFDVSDEAIFTTKFLPGKGPVFVDINDRATKMFKGTRKQLLVITPQEISPVIQPDGTDSEKHILKVAMAAMKGKTQHFEWTHRRLDGTTFLSNVTLSRVVVGDEILIQAIVREGIDYSKKALGEIRVHEEIQSLQKEVDRLKKHIDKVNKNWEAKNKKK